MFRLLTQHPDISGSKLKEPDYFCTDFHRESDRYHGKLMRFPVRNEAQYLAQFGDRSRTVVVEGSPTYLYSRVAASEIHAFNPAARILAMVRNPVDLLQSLHAKLVTYGQEDLRDFRQAIEAEAARRAGRRLPAGMFWPSSLYYSEWVKLGEQIERYRSIFPAHNLKVVVYDDFLLDNLATYAEVIAFLGLNPAFRPQLRQVNVNQSARFPSLTRAFVRFGDMEIKKFLPERMRLGLRQLLRQANLKSTRRAPLDPGLRRELMARFRPEVEDLSRVLQRDLVSLWGYSQPERTGSVGLLK